jgi:iron-sulfur cluster assembly protein
MLAISSSAAEAITELAAARQLADHSGARISWDPQHNGRLRLDLTESPSETDRVIAERGAYVFVDEQVAPLLDDKVLEASREGGTVRFTVLDAVG